MPLSKKGHGIGAVRANEEINCYLNLNNQGRQIIQNSMKQGQFKQLVNGNDLANSDQVSDEAIEEFYSTQTNAFIIPRNEILKFFFPYGAELPDQLADTADSLMLILAAHNNSERGFKVGSPTIVITGVKEVTPKNTLKMENGGDESHFQTTYMKPKVENKGIGGQSSGNSGNPGNPGDPGVEWEHQYHVSVMPSPQKEPMDKSIADQLVDKISDNTIITFKVSK